jgi:hypothetical protein
MAIAGADPGIQVRGAHLKKLRRAKGGGKIFEIFRVKNHDFTPKKHILSNLVRPPPGSTPALCWLSFFDLQILITLLVSSNFSLCFH